MFNQEEIRAGIFCISSIFCNILHLRIFCVDRNISHSFRFGSFIRTVNCLIPKFPMYLIIHPRYKWRVPVHYLSDGLNTLSAFSLPCHFTSARHWIIKQFIHMIFEVFRVALIVFYKIRRMFGEFHVVSVTDNNIQICVIRMMKIIDLSTLQQVKFMAEIAHHSSLGIYHISLWERILEQFSNHLCPLPCFYNLTADKSSQFFGRKLFTTCQSLEFFLCDEIIITKMFPPAILSCTNFRFQREVVTFMTIYLFFYKHKVLFNTVIFNKMPRIDMVNIIEIVIKQIP